APLVLPFDGHGGPALVNANSEIIAASGGTWLESRSAELAGKFAGILLASVPEAKLSELEAALRSLEAAGLHVTIERGTPAEPGGRERLIKLDILGNERPGLGRDAPRARGRVGGK